MSAKRSAQKSGTWCARWPRRKMKSYAGPAPDDQTIGAHGYLDDHPHGHESFNFVPTEDGTVCGYRPPGDREQTHVTRMGAASIAAAIDGALVVWLAKEPGS